MRSQVRVPKYLVCFTIALLASLTVLSSLDAAPPSFNPASQIGAEATTFQRRSRPAAAKAPIVPEIQLPAEEEPVAPTVALKEFFVKEIKLEGSQQISLKELQPILAKFENKKLNLAKLRAIAKNITQYYRLKGFVTSRAFVPPQNVENEIVTIKIVEGKMGKAIITGNKYFKTDWLLQYLTIKPGDILAYDKLSEDLTRMNRNADRQVKAALAAGEVPETSDIILNVEEKYPAHFGYTFDNHGTRLSGLLRQGIEFRHSNLLGRDDTLYNVVNISEHGDFVGEAMNYIYPLSPTAGRLILSYAYSDVELGKELRPLNVKGGANIWGIGYLQPLADKTNWSLDLDSGFDMKEIWSTVNGQDNSRDHLRVVHFGPNLLVRDSWGTTTLKNDFVFGIPSFLGGNVKVDSRSNHPGAGGQFFVDNIDLNRAQKFFWDSVVLARFQTQLTKYPLVSSQEFRAGGFDTVRGYGEGDSLGDYGFLQSTEWHIPPYFIPKDYKVPWQKQTFWEAVQFVGFADTSVVYLRHAGLNQSANRKLIGVGGGLRVNLTDSVSAQIDWAWPIGDKPVDGPGPRLHFGLNTQLPNLPNFKK